MAHTLDLGGSAKIRQVTDAVIVTILRAGLLMLRSRVGIQRDEWRSLTDVWSGLTKRTRTITNDPDAELIAWLDQDADGLSTRLVLHPVTHQALRRALGR